MPNIFDTIGTDEQRNVFDTIPTEQPSSPQLDTSKFQDDPYTKFKMEEAQTSNREDYPITVPPSLNPNYDLARYMVTDKEGNVNPLSVVKPFTETAGGAIQAGEYGIRKVLDLPAEIKNKITGAKPDDFGRIGFNAYTPTFSDREEWSPDGTIIHFPRSSGTGPVAGAVNTVSDLATSMLGNPERVVGLALAPGEGAAGRTAAGLFGTQAAGAIPETVGNAYRLTTNPGPNATVAEEVESLAQPVIQAAFAKQMLGHAAGVEPRTETPQVQGPYALGRYLNMPKGAEPDLKVEGFEPLNAQSGSPLSPQELLERQSRPPTFSQPEPPVRTFNLDEESEQPNATETRTQPKGDLTEHPGDASERPPAQPSGGSGDAQGAPAPEAKADEPIARLGDARGTPDKELPQIADDLNKVAGMSEKEFSDFHNENKSRGGMTGVAHEVGQSIETPEQLADLKSKQEAEAEKFQEAKKAKDFSAMAAAANKGQFFREAYEAATGTGSAGLSLRKSNPNYDPPFPEGKPREFVGMGGAVPSEFNPEGNAGREVYGIAHEVREARAKAGQVDPVERGQGISTPASIDRGRALLNSGVDPEQVVKDFEQTKRVSSDDFAVTRAYGEKLAQDARLAERKFGTDSPEHKAAYDKLSDWDRRTKAMQTEWNKSGMAQQGQTDIDTGTYTGLQREYEKSTGKKFTPKQSKEAKDISSKVTKAADETEKATKDLIEDLKKKPLQTERQRVADAAEKELTDAQQALENAKTQEAATKRALDAANKVVRENAVRKADAENKQRVENAKRDADTAKIQDAAKRKAQQAADKTVRENAARQAKEENERRVKEAQQARETAKVQEAAARKARQSAEKRVRDAAAASAKAARKENVLRADTSEWAWRQAVKYIDSGITNFDDLRNKIATDLGMKVEKVTAALAKDKRTKSLSDDLWKKQQAYRRLDQQAKNWLQDQQTPGFLRALKAVPNLAFAAKVFGHGTVALGTHAPMVAFQPRFWKSYINDFGKMYRMVGSTAFHESQMQDLIRRPNYMTARRAGLVNDPYQYEDYNSPNIPKSLQGLTRAGDRGYSVLKILRQDMFDQQWNKLPKTAQIPEMAKAIADGVNHATGVVRVKAPAGSNIALFAPRLEASRAAWLVVDPLKAAKTFADWGNASEGDKAFAINQVKEKAWVVGTMLALLAANEGYLEASNSKQRINFNDPMKKDWLKFKAAGLDVGYGNAMLSMARLPARLYKIRESDGGKLKNLVYPDEDTYSVLGEYGRSQLSPFASLAASLWFKSDWQNRPLPNSNRPVPKRLRAAGVKPYTWPEFWSEQVLPIPAEEAVREVWKNGLGMNETQIAQARKAMATLAIMTATGARVEDDTDTRP